MEALGTLLLRWRAPSSARCCSTTPCVRQLDGDDRDGDDDDDDVPGDVYASCVYGSVDICNRRRRRWVRSRMRVSSNQGKVVCCS